ncbi:hypothetical protein [Vibrio harveyi]|uniref:hypothetical protein n=1 Tax=Vibrio harveyi TaxID=669 RepID=UPI003909BF31
MNTQTTLFDEVTQPLQGTPVHLTNEELLEYYFQRNFQSDVPITIAHVTLEERHIDKLLELNTNNIPPVPDNIRAYAKDMLEGNWKYNGASIRVSNEPSTLDGQNRLKGAKKANMSFVTDLVLGLDPSVFNSIDTGRTRKNAHILGREFTELNKQEAGTLATAIGRIVKHDKGIAQASSNKSIMLNAHMQEEYVYNHPEILDQVKYVHATFGKNTLVQKPTIAAILHIGSRYNEEYTKQFLTKLVKGVDLSEGETLHHLNQILIQQKHKTVKYTNNDIVNLIFKTWNSVAKNGRFGIKYKNNVALRKDDPTAFYLAQPSQLALDNLLEN